MNTPSWFQNTDCNNLNITRYKSISNDETISSVEIKEPSAIKNLIARIESLPKQGDEMVKPGPKAEKIVLSFGCKDQSAQSIEFINKKIKTPSTGFLSKKNETEENLYRDIVALLEPKINKRLLKVKGLSFNFKNFTVKFTDAEHTPQPEGGPTIGPTSRDFFSVYENESANEVRLVIFSGQIPPQPQAFVVAKKIYYLITYVNSAQESLYPRYFEVSDKLPRRR